MFLKSIINIIIFIIPVIYLVQSKSCAKYIAELADDQMHFVNCVTTHSVPVTVCNSCINYYQNVLKTYDILSTKCTDDYFDKDRINLIASTEFVLTGLWSKAYCDDCFNNNNSMVFDEKNDALYYCFDTHKNNSCENCKLQYLDLNNFYINLDQHNNGEVCYDLQDSMNRTRTKWSKELNCCRREQNLTLFTILLAITSCLPLLFYGTTFCITKRQEGYQRVLFNEDPYNSEVPSSSSHRYNTGILNPNQSTVSNLPSSSNAATINRPASDSSAPAVTNNYNLKKDKEFSDDESLMNSTVQAKEKI